MEITTNNTEIQRIISSVQFSRSVVSNSLWPHESQHARPPCPSPTPGVHSDSCPSNQWWHPAISSSVIPFSSCREPAWGTPPMAKVMRKEAWHTQRSDQVSGNPLFPASTPKTRVCFMLSPTPLTLRGGFPPSPFPRAHSDSRPSSPWCNPAISSSVVPFSSCPQSLPAWESFPVSQLFSWGDQSTGVSALASFLPKKSQSWSPSEWTGWMSLQSNGLSRVFSNTTVQKHQFFGAQPSSQSNSHIHTWPLEKP